MRQQTETHHTLEIRDQPNVIFRPAVAGMYREANLLASDGLLERAMQKACDLHIENYGHMRGVTFRIVSKTTTVTGFGTWEDFTN
jgi:hypothetical protein